MMICARRAVMTAMVRFGVFRLRDSRVCVMRTTAQQHMHRETYRRQMMDGRLHRLVILAEIKPANSFSIIAHTHQLVN